jgi:hypothetical protein
MKFRALFLVVLVVVIPATAAPVDPLSLCVDPSYDLLQHANVASAPPLAFNKDSAAGRLALTVYDTVSEPIGPALTSIRVDVLDSSLLSITLGHAAPYSDVLSFTASASPLWGRAVSGYDVMTIGYVDLSVGDLRSAPNEDEAAVIALGPRTDGTGRLRRN